MEPPHADEDDAAMEAMMQDKLRRRRRRGCILMAFLAGLPLTVVCFLAGAVITSALRPKRSGFGEFATMAAGFLPLLVWELYCAREILKTSTRLPAPVRSNLTLPLALLLGAACVVIVHTLFSMACSMMGGGSFSPP